MTDDDGHAISYLALKRGTPVLANEGTQVGRVYRVQDNAREHIFDGIVVETQEGRRFIDAPEVGRITERAVHLTIDPLEALAQPEPGSRLAARLTNTTPARRASRLAKSVKSRWEDR